MKPTTLLLLASLVANVALVSLIYTTRSAADKAIARASSKNPSASDSAAKSTGARPASATNDAAAADAAGLSPDAARDLALGRAMTRYSAALRGASSKSADGKWWVPTDPAKLTREQRDQFLAARRELSEALIAATGRDFLNTGTASDATLAFLPEAKRDQLRKILSDYQDLMDQYGPANGIQLASDRDKIKLLKTERERDIAALLSPEELADYQMRTSPSADTIRNRYGSAIATEDDFKKIYALQKTYDDKFPTDALNGRITPDVMKARTDASLQLQADIRAAVGDDAYAALRRASDSDLRTVDALAARLSLAPDTVDRVAATRDSYAAESQRIMADTAIPLPQKREQLQTLATRAKSDLTATLGAEAADAYAQRSPWVGYLQGGLGFSTTPTVNSPGALMLSGGPAQSVFPVTPPGQPGAVARQVMSVTTSDRGAGGAGGDFLSIGGAPTTNTQIYSFTTTSSDAHPPADAQGATMTKIMIAPTGDMPVPAPAPATPPKE